MEPDLLDDDALLAALRAAFRAADHPRKELVIANAQDAFSFGFLDDELAELVYDSALEAEPIRSVRAVGDTRTIVFECDALSLQIEIHGLEVVGQLAPPGMGTVTVQAADGTTIQTETDHLGCFRLAAPADGPLRFQVSRRGSSAVTEWTYLRSSPSG